MDGKWVFLINCKVLLYQILCQVTIISQVTENPLCTWVYTVEKEVERAPMRAARTTLLTHMVEKWSEFVEDPQQN